VVLVGLIPWAGYSGSTDAAQQSTATLNQWLRSQATADGNVVFVDTSALGEGNPPRLRAAYERDTRPDHLHPNSAGLDLIARQIAQAAFGRAPAAAETRTALQDFADRNWRSLAAEFYQAAQQGRPQAAVTLMRNLPAGETSIESSLRTLNRDDIPRAIDRIFNDYLHRDSDFLTFCRSQRDYQGVALESVTLSATSTPSDRRLVMRSIQAYLNYVAGRSGEDWYARWRDELRFVSRDVLRLGRDDMSVDGLDNLRMIVAVAAFSWRKANRTAAVGEWASSLGIRPSTTTTAPPQVQPQPAQPAEPQRRRVIQPGAP
jgi:hypothetical protein